MNIFEIPPLLSWVPELLALIAGGFYIRYRSVRHRALKYRYANLLLSEQGSILALALNSRQAGRRDHTYPHHLYDGLIVSTNISHFPLKIRGGLTVIYEMAEFGNHTLGQLPIEYNGPHVTTDDLEDSLIRQVESTREDLQAFRDKCKPHWYDWLITKLMGLSD